MLLEFDLHLQEPKDLLVFSPETYDPFDENALGESGLDFLLTRVIGFWFRPPKVRVRVHLPPNQIQPDTQAKLQRAMQNFCEDYLVENRRERIEFLINNALFLVIALVVLGIIVFVQSRFEAEKWIGDSFLRTTFSYGLDVLAWVALWTRLAQFCLIGFLCFAAIKPFGH